MTTTKNVDSSLVFLNNRYHDPSIGTFISVDPLVNVTGEPYIYASANPTTLSEPSGLCSSFSGDADQWTCEFYNAPNEPGDAGRTTTISGQGGYTSDCRTSDGRGCSSPAPPPVRPPTSVCGSRPDLCDANPGLSGLGQDAEIDLIRSISEMPADEFYDLALDPDEIDDRIEERYGFKAGGKSAPVVQDRIGAATGLSGSELSVELEDFVREIVHDDAFSDLVGDEVAGEIRDNFDTDHPKRIALSPDDRYMRCACAVLLEDYVEVTRGRLILDDNGVPIVPGAVGGGVGTGGYSPSLVPARGLPFYPSLAL